MKGTVKKNSESNASKDEKLGSTRKTQDEKLKKSLYTVSTARSFLQKSTAADIYAQKNRSTVQSAKAPKKLPGSSYTSSNVSPIKDLLKSSPSSISQISRSSEKKSTKKSEAKARSATKNEKPRKKDLFVNVTVNSPVAKRRLASNIGHGTSRSFTTEVSNIKKIENYSEEVENENPIKHKEVMNVKTNDSKKDESERQRTKTRTLKENEVKMLTPDVVDNNAEMLNLSRKLSAKPKAFYVDLDGEQSKLQPQKGKSSDEEISYEEDFESYESDFESYHSDKPQSDISDIEDRGTEMGQINDVQLISVESFKDIKDEERMFDSGSFDLREQRSAKTKPFVMNYIQEDTEDAGVKTSLTDEGFQDMINSSAASSLRIVHVDVLDRPLFIDFRKSKENKRKRRINEHLKQRAKDLLSMITLHEMSYSLFEMKPISYDLYMATFGRSNYTQSAVQTFDDGISEEVQTEEVTYCYKWTQNPVEFSKHDIYLNKELAASKLHNMEDYNAKFNFMTKQNSEVENNMDENYKANPLRIYFEQKDGVGTSDILPYEIYRSNLKNNEYNSVRLRKFLKKFESTLSHVLSTNAGKNDSSDLVKSTRFPFSKGYVSISSKKVEDERLSFMKLTQITQVLFSQTKSNLLMTVHKKPESGNVEMNKFILCLWDISVLRVEPVKILIAIDNVAIGKFRGNTDGIFIAALEDGSIHLWDLSEEPTWRTDVTSKGEASEIPDRISEPLADIKTDKGKNRNFHFQIQCALQACSYTSSAYNMNNGDLTDRIVGLELISDQRMAASQEVGQKTVGQAISLQRVGIITIWCLVQEKAHKCTQDIGKAFWSKLKLEKIQSINLQEHIDVTLLNTTSNDFNLNAAKRRLSNRKQERNIIRKRISRPKTAVGLDFEFDIERPSSSASLNRKVLPVEKISFKSWESGIVCSDLKIMRLNNVDKYLVAKNCGEVLCCRRCIGVIKVERFCVASDISSVTSLEISPHGLPYFLAATDTGTVNLCSLISSRVLLTLDCRNIPQHQDVDKCRSDDKGRFIDSVAVKKPSVIGLHMAMKVSVSSVLWSQVNPCCIYALMEDGALLAFELTHSDIYAKFIIEKAATAYAASDTILALLTPDGEVQAHRLTNEHRTEEYLELFQKYVALL